MRRLYRSKMADSVDDEVNIVANDEDLDRILSHSNAIIGSLDKLDADATIRCNGTSTGDLRDVDFCRSAIGVGVNNGGVTPGVSNATVSQYAAVALTTCAPSVTAFRADSASVGVRAGAYVGQIVPPQGTVQAARGLIQQPGRMMPPPLCGGGPSTAVTGGGRPSGLVTMLMQPSSTPGAVAPQLRAAVGRPPSSVQLVNVGSVTRAEQGAHRLVAVTGGVMPAGVRFIQSSPHQQPRPQPRIQQQQQVTAHTHTFNSPFPGLPR